MQIIDWDTKFSIMLPTYAIRHRSQVRNRCQGYIQEERHLYRHEGVKAHYFHCGWQKMISYVCSCQDLIKAVLATASGR